MFYKEACYVGVHTSLLNSMLKPVLSHYFSVLCSAVVCSFMTLPMSLPPLSSTLYTEEHIIATAGYVS